MVKNDQYYMSLAIVEALKGSDNTFPNPRVGAIIVANGEIISKGYHEYFGGPHAELNAIKQMPASIKNATLYVTLEPCTHDGKTAPCSNLIDPNNFSRVVIGSKDPNQVASGGVKQLLDKGIEVIDSVCEDNCKNINRRFFTFHEKKRPYVILKMALTLDGFIAEESGKSKWITNNQSRSVVHKLREGVDSILVGNRTIENDNPNLTSHGGSRNPKVILFNQNLKDSDYRILDQKPIILDLNYAAKSPKRNIEKLLNYLYTNSYQSLLVEGGGITFTHFLNENIDELHVFYAPKFLGRGIPFFFGKRKLEDDLGLELSKIEKFDNDVKLTYLKN